MPQERESGERKPEQAEAAPEAVDEEVDEAAKEFESEGESFEALGKAEFDRVTAAADLPKGEIDADPDVQDAKRELGEVAAQGRGVVDSFKGRLSGVGSRLKRWGRAALAGAVISGSAMNVAEAATPPDRGPQLEHVEKGPERATTESMAERIKKDAKLHADLLGRFGSEEAAARAEAEFGEAFDGWNEERTRQDLAALAGLDARAVSKDTFKGIVLLSEADAAARHMAGGISAEAGKDDTIYFRASRFVGPDGSIDASRLRHTLDHEKGHVLTSTDQLDPASGEQVRMWDMAGVPHELNEGVTELLALRAAERRGEKLKDQSYAGGNLVAARLLEGIIGTEAIARDYLTGGTGNIKTALEKQLGPGAFDQIMRGDFPSPEKTKVDRPEGLARIMDIIGAADAAGKGALIDQAWRDAKTRDGYGEDMIITPDRKGVILSKDIGEDVGATASGVFEGAPAVPGGEPTRVFVWLNAGEGFSAPGSAEKVGEGIMNAAAINEATERELLPQYAAESGFATDPKLQQLYRDNLQQERINRFSQAFSQGVAVDTPRVVVDARLRLRPFVEEYKKAPAGEKAKAMERLRAEVERIGHDTLARVEKGMDHQRNAGAGGNK